MPESDAKSNFPLHEGLRKVFSDHSRSWRDFRYVYPVISRRSEGLSVGINLNPDTHCNFDCVYCCVDRTQPREVLPVDLTELDRELRSMLQLVTTGEIWLDPAFADVPSTYRVLRDIAFSGDGEPTLYKKFGEACQIVADAKAEADLTDTKIVLITNATIIEAEHVQRGLEILDQHQGEVWAKLDAGDEVTLQAIDRTTVPLKRIVENIAALGQTREIVIQTMLLQWAGREPDDAMFKAYLGQLAGLLNRGCLIRRVQLYTVARQTAEAEVQPVSEALLNRWAEQIRSRLSAIDVRTYPSPRTPD